MASLIEKPSNPLNLDQQKYGIQIKVFPKTSTSLPDYHDDDVPKLKTKFKNYTEEWLVKKKNVPMTQDQDLLDQFNCGFAGNIIVTGKIYITNKRICFYSPFNDKNIFFQSTFIDIPKNEILKIEKKYNAKIFDNSIQITKKNLEKVFFTSFVSRNKCYDLMVSHLLQPRNDFSKLQKSKTLYEHDVEFLTKKVKLMQFEYLIHSFSCGLAIKSNIMGRIYITNERIYFHSMFDENNSLSKQTQVNIFRQEILKIEKRYNTLIFDNSILVISKKGSFFFTSFLSRDQVFNLMLNVFVYNNEMPPNEEQSEEKFYDMEDSISDEQFGKGIQKMNNSFKGDFIQHENQIFSNLKIKNNKKNEIKTYQQQNDDQKVNESEFMQIVIQEDDITEEQLQSRQKQIENLISHQPDLEVIGECVIKFPGLNALKALRIFDSGQEFYINGRKYDDFMFFFKKEIMNRRVIKISKWKPNVLEHLNTSNIKKNCPLEFHRDINEIVKLQKTGIPFMPSEAKSKQVQKLFIFSKDKYIIESYVKNQGAPYSDTFHINGRRVVETSSSGMIKITVSMQTVFKKKPFISSLIETKCEEEGTKQQSKMFEAMKQYFKNLEQSKIKK